MASKDSFLTGSNPTPEPSDNATVWNVFRLATSDFLMIDSTAASMRHQLRADKVEFWARLIPAIWGYQQRQRQQQESLLGDDARCPATPAGARTETWVLGAVVVILATLLVIAALLAARYHCQYRRLSVSTGPQEPVAKI